ncbi:AbrB/MazE/SpoVT family DNA-binding domain-containing protein [Nitrosomonas sp.]|uniref:AbrB/MazE/SpoVT family DNA-binding domain-containing protein n=1 Tax=Nitrosomonas sp. TaxID=42353 RepID=UPI00374DC137
MTEVILVIKQWGNNLGVHLPAAIVREAQVHVDQRVRLTVVDGQIIITPMEGESLMLEQRLAQYDLARHGDEVMRVQHIGAEKW